MTTSLHERWAAESTRRPTSDEAQAGDTAQGFEDQDDEQGDSAARTNRDQRDKAIATARARAALSGFTMHVVANDFGRAVFVLTKWNLTRELPDLGAVAAFLDQAGARHA